ncbi:hypothetical protein QAD02_023675 [Eretmocerus hayati]|uniref:Uncharacterized protein n=1 Tax=Eretmocerus hayati TaxID=131215 RepID=A0ACC2PWB4_9HYME|nr:hypothetical protein QAD02_023675 [Eretmocerus hayati]
MDAGVEEIDEFLDGQGGVLVLPGGVAREVIQPRAPEINPPAGAGYVQDAFAGQAQANPGEGAPGDQAAGNNRRWYPYRGTSAGHYRRNQRTSQNILRVMGDIGEITYGRQRRGHQNRQGDQRGNIGGNQRENRGGNHDGNRRVLVLPGGVAREVIQPRAPEINPPAGAGYVQDAFAGQAQANPGEGAPGDQAAGNNRRWYPYRGTSAGHYRRNQRTSQNILRVMGDIGEITYGRQRRGHQNRQGDQRGNIGGNQRENRGGNHDGNRRENQGGNRGGFQNY